jgi:collagen type III alpha
LTIDANGSVALGGTVDGRGGVASTAATGGTIAGGAAGAIHIGETAPPTTIVVFVPVVVSGGAGGASAGTGGTITPEPDTGNVNVAGAMELDLRGGDSVSAPGAGGLLNGGARKDPGSGGVNVSGEIVASGGSIMTGGSGNGADGGRVDMELTPTDGAVMIGQSARITVEGGASGGSGTAGGGGHVWFFTKDGDETISGNISVRGGDAPDPGGIGGGGGMIYFLSDNNHNAVQVCKGNLDVTSTGALDASGGNGSMGGSGRNDGTSGVASFPANQEEIAIFLNCDAEHGNTCNWMKNDGQLTARGGVHNGSGGDVVYHGIPPGVLGTGGPNSGDYPVPPGKVDNAADGSGMPGDFDGE